MHKPIARIWIGDLLSVLLRLDPLLRSLGRSFALMDTFLASPAASALPAPATSLPVISSPASLISLTRLHPIRSSHTARRGGEPSLRFFHAPTVSACGTATKPTRWNVPGCHRPSDHLYVNARRNEEKVRARSCIWSQTALGARG